MKVNLVLNLQSAESITAKLESAETIKILEALSHEIQLNSSFRLLQRHGAPLDFRTDWRVVTFVSFGRREASSWLGGPGKTIFVPKVAGRFLANTCH
jgi:hypothetical protein